MKNTRTLTGLSVLALAGMVTLSGCANNPAVDDPDTASAFLNIDSITPQQLDASLAVDSDETANVSIQSSIRGLGPAGGTVNDVIISSYTVFYDPPLPDAGGAISSRTVVVNVPVPGGGSGSLIAVIIPKNLKGTLGAATNSLYTVTILVSGADLNLLPASAEGAFTLAVNP